MIRAIAFGTVAGRACAPSLLRVSAIRRPSTIAGANGQQVELLQISGRAIEVDADIAPIVRALNDCGVPTRASCSGHGYRPGNIMLRDGREIIIARDYAEARMIDRLFPLNINGERV